MDNDANTRQPTLRVVNGETRKARVANEVLAHFAAATHDLSLEIESMSGFVVVCFDEHGNPSSRMTVGADFQIPTPLLPMIVEDCTKTMVYARG